jgi:hypothetical protein
MGRNPQDREQVDDGGDYPPRVRSVPVCFDGGPCDGNAVLEIQAPPGLSVTTLEFTDHPEGFYELCGDNHYHWRLH